MWKQIGCGIVAVGAVFLLMPGAVANRNFVPDWTFKGSSITSFRTLGDTQWRAENGEIVGTPKSEAGGWLILDKLLQDVPFASTFRCTGGGRAGVMLRAQSTPEGIAGVYVALPEGQNPAAAFALNGATNGRADDDVATYGPMALYVGGAGEVRFKQMEIKDLGRHVLPAEQVSSGFACSA